MINSKIYNARGGSEILFIFSNSFFKAGLFLIITYIVFMFRLPKEVSHLFYSLFGDLEKYIFGSRGKLVRISLSCSLFSSIYQTIIANMQTLVCSNTAVSESPSGRGDK